MPKKTDRDVLKATLLSLELKRQELEHKIAEIRRLLLAGASARSAKQAGDKKAVVKAKPASGPEADGFHSDLSQVPAVFENKAGHYELIRIDDELVYYSFTNRQGKTVDATMPVIMWLRMQERADQV